MSPFIADVSLTPSTERVYKDSHSWSHHTLVRSRNHILLTTAVIDNNDTFEVESGSVIKYYELIYDYRFYFWTIIKLKLVLYVFQTCRWINTLTRGKPSTIYESFLLFSSLIFQHEKRYFFKIWYIKRMIHKFLEI